MTMRRDPMWDDEERKLAAQLARIAPHGEPSADLDARILAMAERDLAGVSPTATQRRRRTHRWPVWLGAAASLTVVAGLVWQLQPVLEPRQTIRYEAPASVDSDNDPNGKRQPIAYVESAAATDAAMPPPPPPPVIEPVPQQSTAAQASSTPQEPQVVASAAPVAPPPAPPAPPAPVVADAAMQADAAAAKSIAADRAMAQEAPRRPAPITVEGSAANATTSARTGQQSMSAMRAADAVVIESAAPIPTGDREGFDARPPATADTPEVQRAWLKRIRELRDAGQVDDARSSLAAFVKRNPKAEVPTDLKPLLPASTTPSTEP